MTTAFSSSRLANFREKKNSGHQDYLSNNNDLKLTLPTSEKQDSSTYEPTSTFHNTRTSMRLLKGRIEKNPTNDQSNIKSNALASENELKLDNKLESQGLKLTLNDSPQMIQKKIQNDVPSKPTIKRITIAKEQSKQQKSVQLSKNKPLPQKQQPISQTKIQPTHDEKPIIKEEEIQESKDQIENQNDLVICPEGCGRKFNRKALEKHAKACKIVFMSKRKEFNSEAKRLTSKEQEAIIKQNKLKQKKQQLTKTKGKGFDKTEDNWKAASQDFRNAIKGVKIEAAQGENDEDALKTVICEYCDKKFAEVLLEKHLEKCQKKKEKEKKKGGKKK